MEFLNYIRKKIISIDYFFVFLICALSIFGIIVIGSITNIHLTGYSLPQQQQITFFSTGLLLFFIFSFINYKAILNLYWGIYAINLILLILVLFIGEGRGQVTRQIPLPFELGTIQPSQFSKLFMLLFFAKFLEIYKEHINQFSIIIVTCILMIVPVLLIIMQPSLSAGIVVMLVSLTLIFLGGLSFKLILTAISGIIPIITVLLLDIQQAPNHLFVDRILAPYQINRILTMFNPTGDLFFQQYVAMQALGSGQVVGKGLYNGIINQIGRLPEAHNDFIFAVIGEEFGFIGANLVIFTIFLLIIKCAYIAYKAQDPSGKFIAAGAAAILFFQTFIHIGVVTSILPNTGINLPFISHGGSS
ncbi:MAG: FtsW/RodA/SpoVE family cell cycle protein, partial [Defluviitaleaceae bacterium]|nr:FtsW/RodA/SpoVE family cell cycle protein [Defluviitaleaceae bacterium]